MSESLLKDEDRWDEVEEFLRERFPDGFMLVLRTPNRLVSVPLDELGGWIAALRLIADEQERFLADFEDDWDEDDEQDE
jgi:hypothetical protein